MKKKFIKRYVFAFCRSSFDLVNTIYCTFKTEKIVHHKSFDIFLFIPLGYIKRTYSKSFQNSFSKAPNS